MKQRIYSLGILVTASLLVSLLLGACGSRRPTVTPEVVATPVTVATQTRAPATPSITIPTVTQTPAYPPPVVEVLPSPAEVPTLPPQPTRDRIAQPTPAVLVSARPRFASFEEPAVEVEPSVYHEPIAPDLGNVRVPFVLSQPQRDRLARDGFVVSPGMEKEFFTLYEKARYDNVPIFVTSDSLLHIYHLLFDKTLRTAEVEYSSPYCAS